MAFKNFEHLVQNYERNVRKISYVGIFLKHSVKNFGQMFVISDNAHNILTNVRNFGQMFIIF